MDTSYFDDFSNPEDMMGYKDVLLRQAQVEDAEEKAAAAEAEKRQAEEEQQQTCLNQQQSGREGGGWGGGVGGAGGGSYGSLPHILRVQEPWKGAFVGFTFRHQQK